MSVMFFTARDDPAARAEERQFHIKLPGLRRVSFGPRFYTQNALKVMINDCSLKMQEHYLNFCSIGRKYACNDQNIGFLMEIMYGNIEKINVLVLSA
jgi:hypothetical protein